LYKILKDIIVIEVDNFFIFIKFTKGFVNFVEKFKG